MVYLLCCLNKYMQWQGIIWHQAARRINPKESLETIQRQLPLGVADFMDIFYKRPKGKLPERRPWDHTIDLQADFINRKGQVILLSKNEAQELDEFLAEILAKGFIRPSKSPQMLPVFFIPKKDRSKWLVTDYRYINQGTVKNNYPLPLILQLIDCLKGCNRFMKLDLC